LSFPFLLLLRAAAGCAQRTFWEYLCNSHSFSGMGIHLLGFARTARPGWMGLGESWSSGRWEWQKEEDDEELPEFQVSGKIGAKKQRKLEEKQARRAQREVRISCHVLSREEEKRKAKEEEEKREYEEYLKLKESFVVEEEGVEESMTEEQVCEAGSAVLLLDLGASHCSLCPAGVIDDRGKFIYITAEEMAAVAQYIKQRGRVSIAELAQASNSLINLQPDSRAVAPTLA
uniref:DDRGK domain containing 1 n=1 Tax=Serinus canaria TaxID=9135 RepID=A0A8C9N766_SERCA